MSTGEALPNPGTRDGKEFTISGSFDAHVTEHVYPRFKGQSLKDPTVLNKFAGEINGQLLNWVIHEVYHHSHIISPISNAAAEATATSAEYTSKDFKPLILVKPDLRFDYQTYYENLSKRR